MHQVISLLLLCVLAMAAVDVTYGCGSKSKNSNSDSCCGISKADAKSRVERELNKSFSRFDCGSPSTNSQGVTSCSVSTDSGTYQARFFNGQLSQITTRHQGRRI